MSKAKKWMERLLRYRTGRSSRGEASRESAPDAGPPIRIPVLAYHSAQVAGNAYRENDHAALASDLRTIQHLGLRVLRAATLVHWLQGNVSDEAVRGGVVLTCDDGCTLDFRDLEHPTCGRQRSFQGILEDFREEFGCSAQRDLELTSFVIASADARRQIGESVLVDASWLSDDWWADADRDGLLRIESHTWDHNHEAADPVCQREQVKGRFDNIETFEECEASVRAASEWIASRIGRRPRFLAYPWGQSSAYLRERYLPQQFDRHGLEAAFSTQGGYVTRSSDVFNIPRLVFGAHWSSPEELVELLEAAGRT